MSPFSCSFTAICYCQKGHFFKVVKLDICLEYQNCCLPPTVFSSATLVLKRRLLNPSSLKNRERLRSRIISTLSKHKKWQFLNKTCIFGVSLQIFWPFLFCQDFSHGFNLAWYANFKYSDHVLDFFNAIL